MKTLSQRALLFSSALAISLGGCVTPPQQSDASVTVAELMGNAAAYDGKSVRVVGIFSFGSDGSGLSDEQGQPSVAIALPRTEQEAWELEKLNGTKVTITATFNGGWCAHACVKSASGRLEQIRAIR